ncbi:hypothetical protein GPECTOR_631g732 [Gonium pectorale]|uniref:Uncharacterized protein n=1 Tax=Gonium pectorale TaxID=33097 RepID=A0A150FUH7_GONPE|nr:hypothetical protein GPECTOR_631g732 [Gonium pectorale]|eukprot:KXZ41228.1 hypothetical protein GPECTOR_631g732 [Gonium pectorale]
MIVVFDEGQADWFKGANGGCAVGCRVRLGGLRPSPERFAVPLFSKRSLQLQQRSGKLEFFAESQQVRLNRERFSTVAAVNRFDNGCGFFVPKGMDLAGRTAVMTEAVVQRLTQRPLWKRLLFLGGAFLSGREGPISVDGSTCIGVPGNDAGSRCVVAAAAAATYANVALRGDLEEGSMLNGTIVGTLMVKDGALRQRCAQCGRASGGCACGSEVEVVLVSRIVGVPEDGSDFDVITVLVPPPLVGELLQCGAEGATLCTPLAGKYFGRFGVDGNTLRSANMLPVP